MTQSTLRDTRLAPWIAFLRAHAALTRAMSQRLIAEHGLTLSDYEVLLRLGAAPERRRRRVRLSNSGFLSAPGTTRPRVGRGARGRGPARVGEGPGVGSHGLNGQAATRVLGGLGIHGLFLCLGMGDQIGAAPADKCLGGSSGAAGIPLRRGVEQGLHLSC